VVLSCWSPKGGSGTSVFVAACVAVLARSGRARLADLDGDQPAILGLGADPAPGLRDWLRVGPDAPADALERLAVAVTDEIELLPAGPASPYGAPAAAGAALAHALGSTGIPTVVDAGTAATPAPAAAVAASGAQLVVVRGCYLALRRAVQLEATRQASGAVLVEEPGRSLGARDVADVLGLPVVAEVPVRAAIARVVDAGVFVARLPAPLADAAAAALRHVGLVAEGRVA
jgi:hypothetical protein